MQVRLKSMIEMFREGLPIKVVNGLLSHETKPGYYSVEDADIASKGKKFYGTDNSIDSCYYTVRHPTSTDWAVWACAVKEGEVEIESSLKNYTVSHTNGWVTRSIGDQLFVKFKDREEFEVVAPPRVMSGTEIRDALGYDFTLCDDSPVDPRPTRTHAEIEAELGYKIVIKDIPF